jgi:hypothetical protein
MEKTKKKAKFLPIALFAVIIMLAGNMEAVCESAALVEQSKSRDEILPDFLLRWSEYLSAGNESELARIRKQMIEQEKINRDRIASTNGAVLNYSLIKSIQSDRQIIYSFLEDVKITTDPTSFGYIEEVENIEGTQDYSYAHFHTDGWNENESAPKGGEAIALGEMYGNWASGDVYIDCRRGPDSDQRPPWVDYVMVYVVMTFPRTGPNGTT